MHESEKWKWSHSVVSNSSNPMDCSLPGFSVHGIFQAKALEWGAIAFQKKLKKAEGPQTPQRDILNLAFQIFNNREEKATLEKAQWDQAKYHLHVATALHSSKPPSTNKDRHLDPASNAAKKATGPTHAQSQGPLQVHVPAVA